MKKYVSIIAAAALVLTLTACNDNTENKPNNSGSTASADGNSTSKTDDKPDSSQMPAHTPKDIEEAVAKALGEGYLCTADVPADEIIFSNMSEVDLTQIEEYIVKQTNVPSVNLDTVIVLKCKNGYADEAVSALNEKYAQNISYIRQYPFGVAKVEGARLYKVDDTVMFFLAGASPESDASPEDKAKLAADEYKKIDDVVKELFGSVPENLAVIPEDSGNNNGGLMPGSPLDGNGGFLIGG